MLKNYFNTAFRSLLKNRLYTFINIFGLATGICAFLLIIQYVTFERSYESFINGVEDIYRVQLDVYRNGELVYKSSENYPGAGPAMLNDIPEVLSSAKLYNIGAKNNIVVTREDGDEEIVLKHKRLLYAEKDFLPMFDYEMVHGDASQALAEPFKMAISESTARKYFRDQNPIGQFLRLEDDDFNNELCEVTGVFKDSPSNTHLKFDVLISFPTLYSRGDWAEGRYKSGWSRKDFYTYVQLEPGTEPLAVEAKLRDLVTKYKPENIERNQQDILLLQPLSDIHLRSNLTDEPEIHGNGEGVDYLYVIAFFIIIIAWVNYVNLSTARSIERGREVGLRKVLGGYRSSLVVQFLVESLVINTLAVVAACFMVVLVTPFFRQLGGTPADYVIWAQNWFWLSIAMIITIGSLVSGIYPAFVLSSFKPTAVLHGKLKSSGSGIIMRKALVVFQFSTSVVMIIGTLVVYEQMNFMQNRDIGMQIDNTVVIERPSKRDTSQTVVRRGLETFKNGLAKEPDIISVAGSTSLPGKKLRFRTPVRVKNQSNDEAVVFAAAWVDYDYMDVMELELLAGRYFSEEFVDHEDTVTMLTESGVRLLGFENPEDALNKRVVIDQFGGLQLRVIGVVSDFHQENLKEQIIPVLFGTGQFIMDYYLVRVNTTDLTSTLAKVEDQWYRSFPGNPFEYFFLDEYFNSYYESDRQFRDFFAVFAVLAIIIGALGLFGLSSYTALQKTREIAIRKVLGSSFRGLVTLLSKEFLILIGVSILIAWPLVFFSMQEWLNNYPYRIDMNYLTFIAAALGVIIIAFITIGFQILKSVRVNPVEALKQE